MRNLDPESIAGERKPRRQERVARYVGILAALAWAMALLMAPVPSFAEGTAYYTYDELGELATVLYGNNVCTAFIYDASGNWTSQTTAAAAPVWGAAPWGCFDWTHQ